MLGAHYRPHEDVAGTSFSVWAPHAQAVRVVGDFNRWDGHRHAMRRLDDNGVWELFIPGLHPGTTYKFELLTPAGEWVKRADPMARYTQVPPETASVVGADAVRVGRRRLDGSSRRDRSAQLGDERVRAARRLVAARTRLPRARRPAHRVRARARLHPRRVPPPRRAPLRPVVGLPGDRVLRPDQPLRASRRPQVPDRPAAPGRHRRDHGLGARALPERRVGAREVRRRAALRALRPARRRAPRLGNADLQLRAVAGAQLPRRERPVLARGVPHRRAAGGRGGVDALPRLLPQRGRVAAQQGRRPREPRGDLVPPGDQRDRPTSATPAS